MGWATCLAIGLACDHAPANPASLQGAVARVGTVSVSTSVVTAVAVAKRLSARQALAVIVDDELLAQGARERRLDRAPSVIWASEAAVAARAAAHLAGAARSAGPPTDDELSSLIVEDALVPHASALSPSDAISLAARIRQAVVGATSADDFEKRARTIHSSVVRTTVEPVGPFGADASSSTGAPLDPTFVAAAFSLSDVGQTSPVFETRSGWHVIRLVERIAPDPSTKASRRIEMANIVVELRSRAGVDAAIQMRRLRTPIDIETGVDDLMASAAAGTP